MYKLTGRFLLKQYVNDILEAHPGRTMQKYRIYNKLY